MDIQDNYIFNFGKYKGKSLKEVAYNDPQYPLWCHENIEWFNLSKEIYLAIEDSLFCDYGDDQEDPE